MKKLFTLALALLLLASCGPKGYNSYTWEYHELDSRYDTGKNPAAMEAISKYDSLMAPLQEILCYSDDIYVKVHML